MTNSDPKQSFEEVKNSSCKSKWAIEYVTKPRVFRAKKGQLAMLIGSTLFFLALPISSVFVEGLPPLLIVFFVLVAVSFAGRVIALIRFPVVEMRERRMDVYSWFGQRRQFDLLNPIDIAVGNFGIVLKQDRIGAGFGRQVLGKAQFEEFLKLLNETTKRTDL